MRKKVLQELARSLGVEIRRAKKGPPSPIEPWREDQTFLKHWARAAGHTLVDARRGYLLWQFFRQTLNVPGEVAEVGVYRGGTAALFHSLLEEAKSDKRLHLFDTFEGMPEVDPTRDIHRKGDFADTSLSEALRIVGVGPNVIAHPGFFPKTAQGMEGTRFCFAHIDVDIYTSVRDTCAYFYPRMERGGIIMFDDYGFLSCPGAKQAVDEFFADLPEVLVYLPSGQCLVMKL